MRLIRLYSSLFEKKLLNSSVFKEINDFASDLGIMVDRTIEDKGLSQILIIAQKKI